MILILGHLPRSRRLIKNKNGPPFAGQFLCVWRVYDTDQLEKNSEVKQMATDGLNGFNLEQGTEYKFLKLVHVEERLVARKSYAIKFEDTDPKAANAIETFEAKIFKEWNTRAREREVLFCKRKNPADGGEVV
ncbi:hypothetical protein ACH5RR_008410 [Cinchona calisaya]|uniref:Cystatin domain-containing protein n=1 Tax=Cinchona calisaya TaxID=153742 RepID=A0ABD3AD71_9GENT